ncbi:glycerophosphodiester phosphodiesterase [Actinomadura rudentiformis]|uniref:Glycerophosphodiester phosphodiesterase n=1 Tax=Actinomadura rudentiformis TaxID=359158 RepID=A0A6H9YZM9_9ACTN|nr:glycerophosphodiester phosphodiesterase family protein [Actinomadura rudentiformis]KAB2348329.1 glycerophosphodiester phosphodiesterase [Actinomadura rudentiformis]
MFQRLGFPLAAAVAATTLPLPTADATPANAPATPATQTTSVNAARVAKAANAAKATRKIANVAHRGASAAAPENTIAATKLARTKRADLFEIDVQETKDHKLVLMHDTTLARTTNVESVFPGRSPWRVSDFTLAEIRRLDAGSWFSSRYRRERVPTLGETLRVMRNSGLGLLLEIKAPSRYPGIERRIAHELFRNPSWLRHDPRERRLIVQSFDFTSARRFNRLLPKVPIGLLGRPSTAQLPALSRWADQINPRYSGLTASYVKSIHRYKMEAFTYTIDDSAKMRRALKLGVDGIITNKPDVLNRVLRER